MLLHRLPALQWFVAAWIFHSASWFHRPVNERWKLTSLVSLVIGSVWSSFSSWDVQCWFAQGRYTENPPPLSPALAKKNTHTTACEEERYRERVRLDLQTAITIRSRFVHPLHPTPPTHTHSPLFKRTNNHVTLQLPDPSNIYLFQLVTCTNCCFPTATLANCADANNFKSLYHTAARQDMYSNKEVTYWCTYLHLLVKA